MGHLSPEIPNTNRNQQLFPKNPFQAQNLTYFINNFGAKF